MKFKIGDMVIIEEGINSGKLAEVQRYDKDWYVVRPENAIYDVWCTENQLRKDLFDEPLYNLFELPPKPCKFEHRHLLKIDGNYLEVTHKELKELKLLIEGLLNA